MDPSYQVEYSRHLEGRQTLKTAVCDKPKSVTLANLLLYPSHTCFLQNLPLKYTKIVLHAQYLPKTKVSFHSGSRVSFFVLVENDSFLISRPPRSIKHAVADGSLLPFLLDAMIFLAPNNSRVSTRFPELLALAVAVPPESPAFLPPVNLPNISYNNDLVNKLRFNKLDG